MSRPKPTIAQCAEFASEHGIEPEDAYTDEVLVLHMEQVLDTLYATEALTCWRGARARMIAALCLGTTIVLIMAGLIGLAIGDIFARILMVLLGAFIG